MIQQNKVHSRKQTVLSLIIFTALIGITAGLMVVQFNHNPAVLQYDELLPTENSDTLSAPISINKSFVPLPPELAPLTTAEMFEAHNLSDKINGKAELYLAAGFTRLISQRFKHKGGSELWMEAYVYDMGNGRNAFSVFSAQRREDAEILDLGQYSYRTPNALFLVHGRYYVEIIASETSSRWVQPMTMMARTFIGNTPTQKTVIDEMKLFPSQHLVSDSVTLISSDAFGYDGFDKIYTAEYDTDDAILMAYLSRRPTSVEAEKLVAAYRDFLTAFGGQKLETALPIKNAQMVEILETYEIIFSIGPFLAGVREADDKEQAKALATQLFNRLKEVASDS